jgi:RNA-directed DNA polymerase
MWGRPHGPSRQQGERRSDAAESKNLSMRENSKRENREILLVSTNVVERSENFIEGNADMHANRKSDESVVPAKPANNGAAEAPAEPVEERDSAKRNAEQNALPRTQNRNERKTSRLYRVREAARKDSQLKFTTLLHHVNEDCLTEAFFNLKKSAAVGVDGVTWGEYEQNLEANLVDLHGRIHRGAYRAKPSRRGWIPKPDGRKRPLGIAALEDKIVQQAVLWVLQSIYEQDFLGFSYGFRPGRRQHDALDALSVAILNRPVNWILDADLEGFFDNIDQQWLMKFLEHRIVDKRVLRLIRKWLRAGVIEEGALTRTSKGTPQGAVISPLLANVFLHYIFDLWIEWWRHNQCRGKVYVVRYADDFVIGFEREDDARRCLEALRGRLAKFGLRLNDAKTRLIEFGRHAIDRRTARGEKRPETFDFLGFTHKCAKSRKNGWFALHRHSMATRMRATLAAIKVRLRKRMHRPPAETGGWLGSVLRGWLNYHAVPSNSLRLKSFVAQVCRLWLRVLRRRSQKGRRGWTWQRFNRWVQRYLPPARILHPYPEDRFRARLKAGAV